jgi:hypothetical protein
MRQKITSTHNLDEHGNPSGGITTGRGIQIVWQDGPLGRGAERQEPNGAFVEGVIAAARDRIEFYQTASDGRFACVENEAAIGALENALKACDARTQAREARDVEGTHQP